jgi:polyphosphate kinase
MTQDELTRVFITDPINKLMDKVFSYTRGTASEKYSKQMAESNLISRDLSWLQFNYRVLDQMHTASRNVFEKMKFLAITASNFDEFFMIRVGSLYNYIDFGKERLDYSGLREFQFRSVLLQEAQDFYKAQSEAYTELLQPQFESNGFKICKISDLNEEEQFSAKKYFDLTIFPMLTPMMLDVYHTFPIVIGKTLTFAIVTKMEENTRNPIRVNFLQIPQNLDRFFVFKRNDLVLYLPIEEIIRWQINVLFKNVEIMSVSLFRILRNGDISIEESDDIETDLIDDVRRQLTNRKTGRVVRLEIEDNYSDFLIRFLKNRWDIEDDNIFKIKSILDYTGLWQIINSKEFKDRLPKLPSSVLPTSTPNLWETNIFKILDKQDVLLHHPYNTMEPVLQLLEDAATDPHVLSIKLTIYRVAKNSRIIEALLKAAENGKYVSALFELKARFDEENNIKQAQRLQKAGCFVIYGIGNLKTHTKMCLVVRKENDKVTRYVHMATGNYNEETSKIYTDIGLLSSKEDYANDVSEFFNVITGHSQPDSYKHLITSPKEMRRQLIDYIRAEAINASEGKPSGIAIKINSLEDRTVIEELYKASKAGVPIKLIIRGICCLRPGRANLSENITVRSIVGDFLEHTRIFYFHNNGNPKLYSGSADMMVRSFDRRIESLFIILDENLKKEVINILHFNLKDNVNAYEMREDGSYIKVRPGENTPLFNIHKEFYKVKKSDFSKVELFSAKA